MYYMGIKDLIAKAQERARNKSIERDAKKYKQFRDYEQKEGRKIRDKHNRRQEAQKRGYGEELSPSDNRRYESYRQKRSIGSKVGRIAKAAGSASSSLGKSGGSSGLTNILGIGDGGQDYNIGGSTFHGSDVESRPRRGGRRNVNVTQPRSQSLLDGGLGSSLLFGPEPTRTGQSRQPRSQSLLDGGLGSSLLFGPEPTRGRKQRSSGGGLESLF